MSWNDYEDFTVEASSEVVFGVNMKPYLFTLSLQTPKELNAFRIYLIVYLIKSGLLSTTHDKDLCYLSSLMMRDTDFLITCIICMQYYFI